MTSSVGEDIDGDDDDDEYEYVHICYIIRRRRRRQATRLTTTDTVIRDDGDDRADNATRVGDARRDTETTAPAGEYRENF